VYHAGRRPRRGRLGYGVVRHGRDRQPAASAGGNASGWLVVQVPRNRCMPAAAGSVAGGLIPVDWNWRRRRIRWIRAVVARLMPHDLFRPCRARRASPVLDAPT